MAFDEIKNLTRGFLKGWKKGKLKEKLVETAKILLDEKVKNAELEEKIRQLNDENRRLKGEKAKPKIKPANTSDLNPPAKKPRKKKEKKKDIEIDEEIPVDVDKESLPKDAKFVGTRDVVIQEMIIKRRNIKFVIKRYYSKELGKVIEGEIPSEFKGSEFGPQLKAFILYQYYKCRVPHQKIVKMLEDWGVTISDGTVCSILNDLAPEFKEDLDSAREAGLKKCSQAQIDDTGAKYCGENAFTFGVSNKFFTSFHTTFRKNRWAAISALLGGQEAFLVDREALSFIAKKLKKPKVTVFFNSFENKLYSKAEFEELFYDPVFEDVTKKQRDTVRTACAISALRSNHLGPPIRFLISDDAPNFVDLVKNQQLCWVHEIRKYKLCEVFKRIESESLDKLVNEWRKFYKLMKRFRNNQTKELREKIKSEFDRVTSIETLVRPLDEQLKRTKKNKEKLLLFLKYPQLPLHNNLCENDVRERVLKRKISLQNRSLKGMKAWDLMLSLASTCRKLNLSFWRYLEDRVSKREAIPYLGKVVRSH